MKKLKKIICGFILVNMVWSLYIFNNFSFATQQIEILAKSAILIDQATGNVLYDYNSDEQEAPASLTKIMSLILIFENYSL